MTNDDVLVQELRRDEGCVLSAYTDSAGYLTIGIGRLIDRRRAGGITNDEADYLLRNDIAKVQAGLDANFPWWRGLDDVRQRAMQNMYFQLGLGGMMKFTTSMPLIQSGKYEEAAKHLKASLWAKQTPARASRVIEQFRTGTV